MTKRLATVGDNPFEKIPTDVTAAAADRIAHPVRSSPHLHSWLAGCEVNAPLSSNMGAIELPFQRWMKFKEAFSPAFVVHALASLPEAPTRCVDPFGGSGTTAVTCGFLGIEAVTIEVNPFLADLIEAKITPFRAADLTTAYAHVLDVSRKARVNSARILRNAPETLREPGINGRFVFWEAALDRILALRIGIESLDCEKSRRLLKVLLGSILIESSNVVVNGKGRRYRRGWQSRKVNEDDVDEHFHDAIRRAAADLARFGARRRVPVAVLRVDSRVLLESAPPADVALFSPPYPNSFDYTDVYDLELWVLGYLDTAASNRRLRLSTIRSHVQVHWTDVAPKLRSATLARTLASLTRSRDELWDSRICEMIAGYFADMHTILLSAFRVLRPGGHAIVVVGDSCYASVKIPVAKILKELAVETGFTLVSDTAIRAMRTSAQHGGQRDLDERCLTWRRD